MGLEHFVTSRRNFVLSDMANIEPTEDFFGMNPICTLLSYLGFLSLVHCTTLYQVLTFTKWILYPAVPQSKNVQAYFSTYPACYVKIAPARFSSRPRVCIRVVISPEMYLCWFDIGRVSPKYKIPMALYKMFKPASHIQMWL